MGSGKIVTGAEGNEEQPVANEVNINCAEPPLIPVTTASGETTAISGFSETHMPPVPGCNVVVCPVQIESVPEISISGRSVTAISISGTAVQPRSFVTVTV